MEEHYYIINPTEHLIQVYDIVRILPGTVEEPSVTECTITNSPDLEAIQGVEGWGLSVLSQEEYEDVLAGLEAEANDDESEDKQVVAPEKITTRKSKSKSPEVATPESEVVPEITVTTNS
jgi:hypothetical protein